MIDDDDISCELPTWAPDSNPNIVEYFRCCVEQAQISSMIAKSFLTVRARQLPLSEKARSVRHIDTKLRDWYQVLHAKFTTAVFAEPQSLPEGIRTEHILYLHFSYHGNMSATHSIFGHPWNVEPLLDYEDRAVRDQMNASGEALSHAARNIILATRWITVDASAPLWSVHYCLNFYITPLSTYRLVFLFPLLGMINMFVSILKHPEAVSTVDDICLIDVAAGHFAYVEYTTNSAFSFRFIRNVAQWARQAAAQASTPVQDEQGLFVGTQEIEELQPGDMGSTFAVSLFL
jgi:hypothetical protein